jgi:hypothetical protein
MGMAIGATEIVSPPAGCPNVRRPPPGDESLHLRMSLLDVG